MPKVSLRVLVAVVSAVVEAAAPSRAFDSFTTTSSTFRAALRVTIPTAATAIASLYSNTVLIRFAKPSISPGSTSTAKSISWSAASPIASAIR